MEFKKLTLPHFIKKNFEIWFAETHIKFVSNS